MHPKTEQFWGELRYINRNLRELIEGTMRCDRRSLLLGSEFEIFFFDGASDPAKMWDRYGGDGKNPNYTEKHRTKILEIARWASHLGILQKRFWDCTKESDLLIEFRTSPQKPDKYWESIRFLGDRIRQKSKDLGVMPVIHSQHTHVTSNRHGFPSIDPARRHEKYILSKDFDLDVLNAAFSRILPLVMLPEELDDGIPDAAVIDRHDSTHPEFRLLSSEYMWDPVLNLTVTLRAMYASLYNPNFVSEADTVDNYEKATRNFSRDTEMRDFFGDSLTDGLSQVISQYPAVSKRQISIDDVIV